MNQVMASPLCKEKKHTRTMGGSHRRGQHIGLAFSRRLVSDGFRVIVIDVPEDAVLQADSVQVDLSDRVSDGKLSISICEIYRFILKSSVRSR